ncbi:polysaccharide biosynthesis protein [Litchfieldella xinjiangensis]|uniref:polysaccharide biosynthesis protein n=1 Tax=Litchfieldella xinjiangensis TaxID=1166948 RepID=UPI0005BAF27B|nr:nucleoside-diphosphate sugar epimerase/dehydratase [Halomonas xinjiangensis]
MKSIEPLLRLPRQRKRHVLRAADAVLVSISLLLAILIQFTEWQQLWQSGALWSLLVTVVASQLIFHYLGLYRMVIRFMNEKGALLILQAVAATGLVLLTLNMVTGNALILAVPLIFTLLAILTVGGVRFFLRELYLHSVNNHRKPVIIYGAGTTGCELVNSLRHGGDYVPVAFVDDWRGLEGALVEGLPVHRPAELSALMERHAAELVLLAIPSAPRYRRREILSGLAEQQIPVQTVPGTADVLSGRARISDIRDVSVEDLLGREQVPPYPELMDSDIRYKCILVSGAGGSIGSELCRQILGQGPAKLLLLDNCEYALYAIEQELSKTAQETGLNLTITALLASVQQRDRLDAIIEAFNVQTVYHAAAYKHVPLVENNLIEGIRNNVFGTLNLVQAAVEGGVETFVLVSTDKAVRPTNVMGATKRLTELVCQAYAAEKGATRFSMVRFGNVLGSSGSVVPLFRKQIERGGPVAVTHPNITRYFMTIPEAAQLVIQAGAMASNGEVFVLDMGEPVCIHDLAANMIRLSGLEVKDELNPEGDIEIVFTGLRPGEKLYEELLIGGDVTSTRHPRIMSSKEVFWERDQLERFLGLMKRAMNESNYERIKQLLLDAPVDYRPEGRITDHIWKEQGLLLEARS